MIEVAHILDESLNFQALVIHDHNSDDVIEVQRSLTLDEQDRRLGLDTYCLVRHGVTFYGGLLAWAISGNSLVLTLSTEAAQVLMLPVSSHIALDARGLALSQKHLPTLTGYPAVA